MHFLKLSLASFLILSSSFIIAQEEDPLAKRSEIKVNALYLLLGGFELDYEHILNEESSIGLSATFFFEDVSYNWGVTPHYRLFFGKQPALGFFVEGHASLFSYTDFSYYSDIGGIIDTDEKTMLLGGVGLSIGGKFRTSRNVVVEVNAGLGRIFGDDYFLDTYPRFGINVGKRF